MLMYLVGKLSAHDGRKRTVKFPSFSKCELGARICLVVKESDGNYTERSS